MPDMSNYTTENACHHDDVLKLLSSIICDVQGGVLGFVGGSFVASCMNDMEYTDIDVYALSENGVLAMLKNISLLTSMYDITSTPYDADTQNIITVCLENAFCDYKLQIIPFYRFVDVSSLSLADAVKAYIDGVDFTVSQGVYTGNQIAVYGTDAFFHDCYRETVCSADNGIKYPLKTLMRSYKYAQRGYEISAYFCEIICSRLLSVEPEETKTFFASLDNDAYENIFDPIEDVLKDALSFL